MSIFDLFKKIEQKPVAPTPAVSFVVCGLGNPGARYDGTRHNAGFMAVDLLAAKQNIRVNRLKFKALYGEGEAGGARVILLKPQTFMNASGESVREALAFYKLPPERLVVLADDIALPPGKLRIREKGSDGGHNGLKSIIYQLSSDRFYRIKIGVGSPPHPEYDIVDWVLGRLCEEEKKTVGSAVERAAEAVSDIITLGYQKAAGKHNG